MSAHDLPAAIAVAELPAAHESTVRDLAAASISASTRRAYAGALARFDAWLAETGAQADDAGIAAYLAFLADAGKSPAVAGGLAAALRFRAKLAGNPDPIGPASARVLAGYRRSHGTRGAGQVGAIRWEQADAAAAVATNGGGSVAGLRDAAIFAVMSDAMLRVSETAALDIADLEADGENTITVRRSKTDQEGEGAAPFIGPATVKRVRRWLEAAGAADPAAPLFQRLDKAGKARGRLSARSIRDIVKRRAADAGIEGRVSGHSLRVGAAQSLAAAGASVVEMQQAGRWKSPDMPGRYARGQLAARGAVARLRYGAKE